MKSWIENELNFKVSSGFVFLASCCVQLDNHEIIIMIQRAKTSVCAKIHMINVTFLTQNVKYFLFVLHHNLPLILKYLSLFNYFSW